MCRTGVQHRLIRCSGLQIWQRFSWRCFDTLIKRCKSYLVPIVSRRAELGNGQPSSHHASFCWQSFVSISSSSEELEQYLQWTPHWRFCGESVRTFWWQYFFVSLVSCKDYLPVIGQWDLMGATLANHRQQTTKVSEAIEKVVAEMVKCQFIWKWLKQNQWDRIATASLYFIKC